MTNHPPLIAPLRAGPVDVVGDVHGEIDALNALLAQLGYDERGAHAQGRHLIFITICAISGRTVRRCSNG